MNKSSNLLFSFLIIILNACSSGNVEEHRSLGGNKEAEKGFKLVNGIAACGHCHGAKAKPNYTLTGGQVLYDKYGEVIAPNLTAHKTALKDWHINDYNNAIRYSVRPDGETFSNEFHKGYEWISEDDMVSIVTYLRTMPAEKTKIESRSLSSYDLNVTGFFDSWKVVENYVPSISKTNKRAYGRYLVNHLANCASCHSTPETLLSSPKYLEGGKIIRKNNKEKKAPNISNANSKGIGKWSESDIVKYLKTGVTLKDKQISSGLCPIEFYQNADEADLMAIAHYLKSVRPEN
jgi:cytochrome c553